MDAENPVWSAAWDAIREVTWEGYTVDVKSKYLIRTTHVNKVLTKISKISPNVQVI